MTFDEAIVDLCSPESQAMLNDLIAQERKEAVLPPPGEYDGFCKNCGNGIPPDEWPYCDSCRCRDCGRVVPPDEGLCEVCHDARREAEESSEGSDDEVFV